MLVNLPSELKSVSVCSFFFFLSQIKPQKGNLSTKYNIDYVKRTNCYIQLFPVAPISLLFLSGLLFSFCPEKEVRREVDMIPLRRTDKEVLCLPRVNCHAVNQKRLKPFLRGGSKIILESSKKKESVLGK